MSLIEVSADGWYHPASVEELKALIVHAHDTRTTFRVRGAGMSAAASIIDGGYAGKGAPPDGVIGVVIDKLSEVEFIEVHDDHAIVSVEAGCLLGPAYDDVSGGSWDTSLTKQLFDKGYALDQLGGVSHQAVGGFLMTGSGGGTIKHPVTDDLLRLQIVDGKGELHDLSRDDAATQEKFYAAGVSMGLLGVVVKAWFRVGKTFNIKGHELTTTVAEAKVDFLGSGVDGKPSLETFFRETPYSRIMWWPQNDFNRVQVWQADRIEPTADFEAEPFELLSQSASLAGSILMTILGNLDDLSAVPGKLDAWQEHLDAVLDGRAGNAGRHRPEADGTPTSLKDTMKGIRPQLKRAVDKHPDFNPGDEGHEDVRGLLAEQGDDDEDRDWSDRMTDLFMWAVERVLDGHSGILLGRVLKRLLPGFIDELLPLFVPKEDKPFQDYWHYALPMDNQMEESLWHTQFTELWVPVAKAPELFAALSEYYAAGGDVKEAYRRTGPYVVEIYPGPKSKFWMSPGYEADCIRVNVFWFDKWAGSPKTDYYPPIWDVLKPFGFRTHWGKHVPGPSAEWAAYFRQQLPKMEEFLALRAQLDPHDIFLTDYWRDHLGVATG